MPLVTRNVDRAPAINRCQGAHRMSELMSRAWVAMAETSDPHHPMLPEWAGYQRSRRTAMVFDLDRVVADDDLEGATRAVWDGQV